MKPTDLRIGNYVNVPRQDQSPFRIDLFEYLTPTECKVGMNTFSWIDPNFGLITGHPLTWYFEDLSPIPLTEDLLTEKLGFETDGVVYWKEYSNERGVVFYIAIGRFKDGLFFLPTNNIRLRGSKIEFVHKLQNLIHALTGEELTLK